MIKNLISTTNRALATVNEGEIPKYLNYSEDIALRNLDYWGHEISNNPDSSIDWLFITPSGYKIGGKEHMEVATNAGFIGDGMYGNLIAYVNGDHEVIDNDNEYLIPSVVKDIGWLRQSYSNTYDIQSLENSNLVKLLEQEIELSLYTGRLHDKIEILNYDDMKVYFFLKKDFKENGFNLLKTIRRASETKRPTFGYYGDPIRYFVNWNDYKRLEELDLKFMAESEEYKDYFNEDDEDEE